MGFNTSESIFQDKTKVIKKAVLPEVKPEPVIIKPIISKAKWPKDNTDSIESIFGKVADYDYNDDGTPSESWESSYLMTLELPYPMRLSWNTDVLIRKFACNRAVYQSLATIMYGIWDLYGKNLNKLQEARMDLFGGCYNFRPRRGGHTLSLHSWGAAIDLDPENNPQGKKWQDGKGMMPKEVIQLFLNEGATWGGTFSNPDPMHFQFCSE